MNLDALGGKAIQNWSLDVRILEFFMRTYHWPEQFHNISANFQSCSRPGILNCELSILWTVSFLKIMNCGKSNFLLECSGRACMSRKKKEKKTEEREIRNNSPFCSNSEMAYPLWKVSYTYVGCANQRSKRVL